MNGTPHNQGDELDEMRDQVSGTIVQLQDRYLRDLETDGDEANAEQEEEFSSDEILSALHRGEDGDAALFNQLYTGGFVYDHSAGRWFRWMGNHWEEDITNSVTAAVDRVVQVYEHEARRQAGCRLQAERQGQRQNAKRCKKLEDSLCQRIRVLQTAQRKRNILKLASADWSYVGQPSIALRGDEWDSAPWLLACLNGVIDLRNGDFQPGCPEDYIRTAAPTEWEGISIPAPLWMESLHQIFNEDEEVIRYVQRLFGYAITGYTTEHIIAILWGKGRNGKGTILETLSRVLGDLAGPIEAEMLLQQGRNRRSGSPTSDIMSLWGKRIVWASEPETERQLNVGKLKWLTGGDTLTGRAPYGRRQVAFRPNHTVFLLTNFRPSAPPSDYALWERVHLIPFALSFVENPTADEERMANPHLITELQGEASGILSWLVEGCLAWQREGLNPPDSVRIATRQYREEEDLVGRFIDEECIVGAEQRVRASTVYEAYREWCEENGLSPLSNPRFSGRLLERFERSMSGRHRYYLGITVR